MFIVRMDGALSTIGFIAIGGDVKVRDETKRLNHSWIVIIQDNKGMESSQTRDRDR